MKEISFHKLTWTDLQRDCLTLYKKHLTNLHIDLIVSISRGGTVVSRIFSDLLGSISISHIAISSYKDLKKQKHPQILETPNTSYKNESILLVDEVSDTGETFHLAKKFLSTHFPLKIYVLSPYIKPQTKFLPDFWEKNIDAWIVFPYDIRETAEGFVKQFGSKQKAAEKMYELGFAKEEVELFLS